MNAISGALPRACLFVSAFAVLLTLCAPARAANPGATAAPGQYAQVLRSFNPEMSHSQSADIATHVLWLSSYYDLDPRLLVAIVGVESSWHSRAVSGAGAQGLGQLMPATAGSLNVLAFDIYENLDGTARYLRRMLQNYADLSAHDRYARAIASYNAGPGAVARAGGAPPTAETRAYVVHVIDLWDHLKVLLPGNTTAPLAATRDTPRLAAARKAPRALPRPDSVADFTRLDLRSMQLLAATELAPAPAPTARQMRGLRRWLARAFGSAHR